MRILTTRLWSTWLAGAGLLAIAAAVAIAAEARHATRAHRAAAEETLRDHAGSAALTYRERLITRAYFAVDGVLRAPGSPARHRAASDSLLRCVACAPVFRPAYFLRLTLADSALEIDGPPLAAPRRAELIARLSALAPSKGVATGYYSLVDTLAPNLEMVYFAVRRGPGGGLVSVDGFAVGRESLVATMLRPLLETAVLLPLTLPRNIPNDSLLSVTILERGGARAIDLSPRRHPPRYSASIHGSRFLGAWTIRVALDPATAPGLLIGGLPPSRDVPLAALAVVTAVLIGAAVFAAWRALELSRLRADFLAGVSHELRTPLSQILLFGESLSLGRMATRKDVRSAGNVIVGETRRLLALVDNVLTFTRGDRARATAVTEEPLAPLVRDVVASFAPVAAASGATVRAERLDQVTAPVDRRAVRQILLNLLDNAAKYGPRGQTITVGLALVDGSANLWVGDEGPGIPPGDRERVWQPFTRLDRDRNGHAGGSGIGLALVRELVDRHRGSARIDATPSGGTCVVVALPGGVAAEASCAS